MSYQKDFDKFAKLVNWSLGSNDSWTATYHTKYVCYTFVARPHATRKSIQSEVLEYLFNAVVKICTEKNLPLFE